MRVDFLGRRGLIALSGNWDDIAIAKIVRFDEELDGLLSELKRCYEPIRYVAEQTYRKYWRRLSEEFDAFREALHKLEERISRLEVHISKLED